MIQRSNDGGKTWEPVGNKFAYDGVPGTHQWYDGTQHPWEFKRVWHLEPSLTDPDTVYAGVEDAALFRTTDGGDDVAASSPGLRGHETGAPLAAWGRWDVPAYDHPRPERSRPDLHRDLGGGGVSHRRRRHHLAADQPRPALAAPARCDAEVGHCVHRIAMHPSRPGVLFMQKHWDVMRSDNAGDSWQEVSGNLPTDFGFPIDVHAHEPETIYVVPIKSDSEHFPLEGKLRVYRSRTGGNEWEALTNGLPQSDCYVNVLRDAMAVDTLDPCGVYFGTTGGPGLCLGRRGGPLVADRPRSSGGLLGRSPGADMIRVVLPYHLRTLAQVDGEVSLDVEGTATLRAVLDALSRPGPAPSPRDDPRPRHPAAAALPSLLRVRAGPLCTTRPRKPAPGGRRNRSGAPLDRRGDRRRIRGIDKEQLRNHVPIRGFFWVAGAFCSGHPKKKGQCKNRDVIPE